MVSTLTWIDHDSRARERTLRILAQFQEKESRDELGIGTVRDSLADLLFPGTSTIQTRLRYMLFVPWIYRALEDKKVSAAQFAGAADKHERELVRRLQTADDHHGMFGKNAGGDIKRLPSSVYWAGLGAWHIRLTPFSQGQYHQRIDETYRQKRRIARQQRHGRDRADDPDTEPDNVYNWHPRLPATPADFPEKVTFLLTRDEAEFIRDRLQVACPHSLLAFLALQDDKPAGAYPWEYANSGRFSTTHQTILHHARLFSEVMHGAALSYNYQLAKKTERVGLCEHHEENFQEWRNALPLAEIARWNINELWALTHREGHQIAPQTRHFIESWVRYIRTTPDALLKGDASALIEYREKKLKGPRSRFTNKRAQEQWSGHSGTGRINYRWNTVKTLLADLHQGLCQEAVC
ncbi:hypothetical protein ACI0Z1_002728 [Cronobacter malonaticus]